ncbi:LuxR family transcriptional regulator [Streptomyces sp. MBT51]|nr:LuxR family transcriptional regulator [Streptomyces sp. MBT51]
MGRGLAARVRAFPRRLCEGLWASPVGPLPAPGAARSAGLAAGVRAAADPRRVGDLTERGTQVLSLVAQGLSDTETAGRPVVAEQTVKTHVSRRLARLRLRDRTRAAVYAYESGLMRPAGH